MESNTIYCEESYLNAPVKLVKIRGTMPLSFNSMEDTWPLEQFMVYSITLVWLASAKYASFELSPRAHDAVCGIGWSKQRKMEMLFGVAVKRRKNSLTRYWWLVNNVVNWGSCIATCLSMTSIVKNWIWLRFVLAPCKFTWMSEFELVQAAYSCN